MADEAPNPGTPAEGTPNPTPSAKPDWVPDKFWKTDSNEVDVQTMASAWTDLSTRFSKGKEALKPEIEKEIFAKRPESPDAYKLELPKEGPLVERLTKANIVLLDAPPEQQEEGKAYYVFDKTGPVWNLGKTLAHKAGLSNEEFMEIAAAYAEAEVGKQYAQAETMQKALENNRKILGDDADKRLDFLKGKLNALAGEKAAEVLDIDYLPASAIQALETILEKTGQSKFSPEDAGNSTKHEDIGALEKEKMELMQKPDYFENQKLQDRVDAINARLHPGIAKPGAMRLGR